MAMDVFLMDAVLHMKAMAVCDMGCFRKEMAMAIFESVGTLSKSVSLLRSPLIARKRTHSSTEDWGMPSIFASGRSPSQVAA